ncbi:MAG: ATP-binding cassette domain-containing protein [Deltaproteobacteria bacterium]|nr:ATP-binding cassette domain-containing protein [Deltaproteobacteria bacterium]
MVAREGEGPHLEAAGLLKAYGRIRVLEEVSLTVAPGECVALVGESGAGKTTLLRCFNRLVEPDEGIVRVFGQDVRGLDPAWLRRRVGYVPQEGGLLPHWSVLRNVALVPRLLALAGPEALAREALARVGMDPAIYGARWPRELSGGQRQRVAFARALAARPGLVLLDEPFGALDAITRSELIAAFARLRRELGLTALLVTHDLGEARRLADRLAVMRGGQIVQLSDWSSLQRAPSAPYVRDLFARAGFGSP